MWSVSAKATSSNDSFIEFSEAFYEPEEFNRSSRPVGFCTNPNCFGRPDESSTGRYFVDGIIGLAYIVTKDQDIDNCGGCGYSLFWSNSYEYLTNKQCKERKIRTLAELYAFQRRKGL